MPTRSLASVIPTDDDTDAHSGSQTPTAAAPPDEPATDESAEKPAEKQSASGKTQKAPARAASSTPTPRKSRRGAGATKTTPASPAARVDEVPATEQRTGRARIPKAGPVTRVTVDLAVTEQNQLDKLTGQIGREIGRGHGKHKIYPQHLMRVAIRRLLSDESFRRAVAADLAENRDELKRPQR